jgi:hypothetical protein
VAKEEMSDTKHQYSIGFEEWVDDYLAALADQGYSTELFDVSNLADAWSAGALRMESVKDGAYSKLSATHQRMVDHNRTVITVRKEVHRDDYSRAGILIAGLKLIERLGREEAATAAQCAGIATETLAEALKSWKDK